MNINGIGAVLGALALAAILAVHGCDTKAPKPIPAPVSVPVPVAKKPAPAPAPKIEKKTNSCTVRRPCHTVEPTGDPKKPVYRKVLKGGKLGGSISCAEIPAVARQFPADQVIAAAKQYGMTPAQLAQLRVCLN